MNVATLHQLLTAHPADTSGLIAAMKDGLDPARVVAVIGKTEGNGCVNDFTRGMAAEAWQRALPGPIVAVMSGGTEGVLCPHVSLVAEAEEDPRFPAGALVAAVGRTSDIPLGALGGRRHADAVADAVTELCAVRGLAPADVHFAVVKCPLRTTGSDTYGSMARSRAASALGAALALGEITDADVDLALAGDMSIHSSIVSASAGVEVNGCEIVLLAHHPDARGPLRASHTVMADALDIQPVQRMLDDIRGQGGLVTQLFAKAESDPSGAIRGRRHTMLTDSDVHATRHARAAVGSVLAALVGDTAIYVSGGAEHQGPPGGGPVTAVWTLDQESVAVDRHETVTGDTQAAFAVDPVCYRAAVRLSEREWTVLRLLRSPLTLSQIGNELFVSGNTVKSHTQAIYRKLGVNSRAAAVEAARPLIGWFATSNRALVRGGAPHVPREYTLC